MKEDDRNPLLEVAGFQVFLAGRIWVFANREDGLVEILPHAWRRMNERDINVLDLQHVIRYGRVVEHNQPGELWRYKLEGSAVDGGGMSAVVEVDGRLIIITVITSRRKRA